MIWITRKTFQRLYYTKNIHINDDQLAVSENFGGGFTNYAIS